MKNHTYNMKRAFRLLIFFLPLLLITAVATRAQNDSAKKKSKHFVPLKWYANSPVLNRYSKKIDIHFADVPLVKALQEVAGKGDVRLSYNKKILAHHKVTAAGNQLTVIEAVEKILKGTGLQALASTSGQVVIKKQKDTASEDAAVQQTTVSGTVTDAETGNTLPGVNILVVGGSTGTATDGKGHYSLGVSSLQDSLRFSYIGYQTKTVAINGRTSINVTMEPKTISGEEMVVVGYGTQKKEKDVTGAISSVDMSTREGQPITNVGNALYGVSGLHVNLIQSAPGIDRPQIRIRGIGNLKGTGSSPLVLVDGVEYPMAEVNPDDIANITVLKDASAAIYGSRAANGVILITTKKGKGEAKINYNNSFGVQQPTYMPDVIWDPIEYMKLYDQAERNEGKKNVTFSKNQIHEYAVGMHMDPYTYPSNNWFDIALKNGTIQKHNLSISQGTDKYSYRASLGYLQRDGVIFGPGNNEHKYSLGLNSTMHVNSRLKVGVNVHGYYRDYTEPTYKTGNFFKVLMRSLPIMPDTLRNGNYGYPWLRVPGRNNWENPRMYAFEGSYKKLVQRFLTTINATYTLPFGLSYQVKFGADKYDGFLKRFVPKMTKYQAKTKEPQILSSSAPRSYNYDYNNLNIHFYNTLKWKRDFAGGHDLDVMVGASYDNYDKASFNAQIRGYFDNTLTALDVGSDPYAINGKSTRDVLESYFGRINYDYKDKYLLQGIFRFDGSSRFAAGHRWSFFPGISAGWRIDKEPFLASSDLVSLLKLRASAGQVGNQAVALYSYQSDVTLGHDYSFGGTNGELFQGAAATALADPTTSWETTTDYDLGLDAGLWQNRLSLKVDLYKKYTTGLLRTVDIPDQVGGLSGPKRNVGAISNTGYEVGVKYRNNGENFNYSIYGNVSYNKNRVEDLRGEIIYNNSNSGLSTITKEGGVVSDYYVLQAEGIFQSDEEVAKHATQSANTKAGYIKYKDVNGDGKIDDDDRVPVGVSSVTPKYTYGFGFDVGYKGISLSAQFQGVGGYYVMPVNNLAVPFNNGAGATWKWATDSWTPQRKDASLPIVTEANYGDKENFKPSTFWLKNASYLRLRSLQLNYKLPERWLSTVRIKKLSIFINAENWLTITPFKEADPEGIYNATSLYHYPMLKTINGGINVTF